MLIQSKRCFLKQLWHWCFSKYLDIAYYPARCTVFIIAGYIKSNRGLWGWLSVIERCSPGKDVTKRVSKTVPCMCTFIVQVVWSLPWGGTIWYALQSKHCHCPLRRKIILIWMRQETGWAGWTAMNNEYIKSYEKLSVLKIW